VKPKILVDIGFFVGTTNNEMIFHHRWLILAVLEKVSHGSKKLGDSFYMLKENFIRHLFKE